MSNKDDALLTRVKATAYVRKVPITARHRQQGWTLVDDAMARNLTVGVQDAVEAVQQL